MELKELIVLLHRESQIYLTWSIVLYYGGLLFLCWLLYRVFIKPQLNPLLKQLPHKPFRPLVGNFFEVANEEAIAPFSRWVSEYKASLMVYHWRFGSVRILSADRGFMKHVLVTNSGNYPKPPFYFRRLRKLLGDGLVMSEGEVHHTHRKLCNGSFRQSVLQNFVPVMEKHSQRMCELWLKKVQENVCQEYTEISPNDALCCMTGKYVTHEAKAIELAQKWRQEVDRAVRPSLQICATHEHQWIEWLYNKLMGLRHNTDRAVGDGHMEISPTADFTVQHTVPEVYQLESLDIIGECGFGYQFNSLNNPGAEDVLTFQRLLGVFGFSYKLLIPFFANLPTAERRQWDSDLAFANTCVATLINKKKKILSSITEDDRANDLLTSLLAARDESTGEGLSSREIRDHVFTFMLAGYETTSAALLWCLLCLSRNPEVQEKLRKEVKTVTGPLTWDKVEQLRYLNGVVKDTLRLYPPVSITYRQTQNDDRFGQVFIPKGTVVNLSIGALHRNPEYWDDPMTFKPGRFMDDTTVKPYTFLPFIAGPRMCIGYKFALMEMKVALLVLLQKLNFLPIPGTTYKCKQRITMRPFPDLEFGVSEVK